MASIRTEFSIESDADRVWRVVGDWADGPVDMARSHVVSCDAEGTVRVVTFADGRSVRERLVARDDDARRIVYSMVGDAVHPEHDNAVMHVVANGPDAAGSSGRATCYPTNSPNHCTRRWKRRPQSSSAPWKIT
jgi:Polyketide cyclase / dehydrase and lipid transport